MENAVLMQVDQSLKDLVQEALSLSLLQRLVSMRSHVFLKIVFHVLEDQVQLLLRVNDLFKPMQKQKVRHTIPFNS